ncbi:MAG: zinc-binding dehydrogenase [Longimicrobiales bacterium]|nr:zinc-binding dehydrogenase [Longimicrobiales bacterium]
MRAVTFDISVPRFLLARSLGRMWDGALYGAPSGVRLRDVPLPPLPGGEWVRLRVLKAGICGSDIGNLTYTSSPAMEPFGSFPAVPGHEIVARVEEVGPAVRGLERGQRVTVDPMISCRVRGWDEAHTCRSCREGLHSTCENAGEEGPLRVADVPFAPGLTQGYHRSLPGGWGEQIVAHRSQLFPVDDALEDHAAVLVEPLAVGVHAVLNAPPEDPAEPALVLGSGPIALGTVWALRASGFTGEIFAQTKRSHEARLARLMGASQVVSPGAEAREALVGTGAMAYMPLVGEEVYSGGGFPLIFDCVGSGQTLSQAMRYATPRGRIVMLGCAAQIPRLDLTFVWARELRIQGFVGYGRERFRGAEAHTFQVTHDLLLESGTPVQDLVTHVYPLSQYREALGAAGNRRRSGSVKVLLDPAGESGVRAEG